MNRADVDLIQQIYARCNAGELERMLELIEAAAIHAWRVDNGKLVRWCSFRDEEEALVYLEQHP